MMPITTAIKARKVSREMMAWTEPKQKPQRPATLSGLYLTHCAAGAYLFTVNANEYTSELVSFDVASPQPAELEIAPFIYTAQVNEVLAVVVEVKSTVHALASGYLVAVLLNGEDFAYCDATTRSGVWQHQLKTEIALQPGDKLTIQTRAKNTTSSAISVPILSVKLALSHA